MFDIKDMMNTMTPEEIMDQVQKEIAAVQAAKVQDNALNEAREEAIHAFCEYMFVLSESQFTDEEMTYMEKNMRKKMDSYEKMMKTVLGYTFEKKDKDRLKTKVKVMNADEVLRDFLKGLE